MCNAIAYVRKGQRQVVLALINTAFAQDNVDAAEEQWAIVAGQLRTKVPKLATYLDDARDDVACVYALGRA